MKIESEFSVVEILDRHDETHEGSDKSGEISGRHCSAVVGKIFGKIPGEN